MRIKSFISENWGLAAVVSTIIIMSVIILIIWHILPSFTYVGAKPIDQVESAISTLTQKNSRDFYFLYKANIAAHLFLIGLSILATILAGVTTKDNIKDIKIWSIIATSLTAAIGTGLSTFHVHKNLETLASLEQQINMIGIEYSIDRGDLAVNTKKMSAEIKRLYPTNKKARISLPIISGLDKKITLSMRDYLYCEYWKILTELDEKRLLMYADIGWKNTLFQPKNTFLTPEESQRASPQPDTAFVSSCSRLTEKRSNASLAKISGSP